MGYGRGYYRSERSKEMILDEGKSYRDKRGEEQGEME